MDVTPDAAPLRLGGPTGPVAPPLSTAAYDLSSWLRDEVGIEPTDVPLDGVYLDDADHQVVIVERYLRIIEGARYVDGTTGTPAREVAARVRIDRPAPHLPVASGPVRRLAHLEHAVRVHADRVKELNEACYFISANGGGDTRDALIVGMSEANAALHAAIQETV